MQLRDNMQKTQRNERFLSEIAGFPFFYGLFFQNFTNAILLLIVIIPKNSLRFKNPLIRKIFFGKKVCQVINFSSVGQKKPYDFNHNFSLME